MAEGKRGRPALPVPVKKEADFDDRDEMALLVRKELALSAEQHDDMAQLYMFVGAAEHSRIATLAVKATGLRIMAEIKERKLYRKWEGEFSRGAGRKPMLLDRTWATFCEAATGLSENYWDKRIAAIPELGIELAERLASIGIGTGAFASLGEAPSDAIERLKSIEDLSELKRYALDIAADNKAKEKVANDLRASLLDLKEDAEAKDKLIAAKDEKINDVETKLRRWKPKEGAVARTLEDEKRLTELQKLTLGMVGQAHLLATLGADIMSDDPQAGMVAALDAAMHQLTAELWHCFSQAGLKFEPAKMQTSKFIAEGMTA